MNLRFVCSREFKGADEICNRVQMYLPGLITQAEIIRSEAFKGFFDTLEIVPTIERLLRPDWKRDIIFVVIQGALYFADIELTEAVGCTVEGLPIKADGTAKAFTEMPKLGALLLPNNMSVAPRGDVGYLARVGLKELLHYFRIPEKHDDGCFFHCKTFGEATVEDCWKDYCSKCREFMGLLKEPLDFRRLFVRMEEIYGLRRVPWWQRGIRRLRRLTQI
ncbi:MAG: hypothetical protein U5R49_06290 [Deltaproteobacteria bacterium]|nr:hypothetical protein [Deltaproteobacteria bacterium]